LWLIAGLVVAGLAALVGFIAISNSASSGEATVDLGPTVSVVVATTDIPIRTVITASDVQVIDMSVDQVPSGALASANDAVGMVATVDIYSGEILLDQRLLNPNVVANDGRSGILLDENSVLMALPTGDLMSQTGTLQAGDQIDLLFTVFVPVPSIEDTTATTTYTEDTVSRGEEKQVTFDGLQNGTISAIVAEDIEVSGFGTAQALMIAVDPQDALILKYVLDADGIMDVVLRAPGADQSFDIEAVDMDYLINRYQLPDEAER